jgi:superfamily II DNA or RNA helicase
VNIPPGQDVWRFVQTVAGGRYGEYAAQLARSILEAQHRRVQLYEDALGGRGRKLAAARRLAKAHRPAVVFRREICTGKAVAAGIRVKATTVAHSQMGDRYIGNIQLFKEGYAKILVMTRDLGKRGVDFPMAKSLVVLSPKNSVTAMDQELCRTRSTVKGGEKQVYVLYYARTYEEEKLRSLLSQLVALRMYGKHAKFALTAEWTAWLHNRSPNHTRVPSRNVIERAE